MINLANLYRKVEKGYDPEIAALLEKDHITFNTPAIFFASEYRDFCVKFVAHCRKLTMDSFNRMDKAYWALRHWFSWMGWQFYPNAGIIKSSSHESALSMMPRATAGTFFKVK